MPLYMLGFMGATRRLDHYDVPEWQPLFIVAAIGAAIVLCGVGFQVLQLLVSIRDRKQNRDPTGDPWNGRTLEWSTTSPPPFYNFAITPEVHERDPFWAMKHSKIIKIREYHDIHMPKNTPMGVYIGALSFVFGFAIIWYMFWLAILSGMAIVVCTILRLYEKETEYYVTAEEVKKMEGTL